MRDVGIGRGPARVLRLAVALLGLGGGAVPVRAAGPADGWSAAATGDLAAMHDLIRDDHPAPVDDQDPGLRT